ncbi:MAG: Crp/Fnr family transcriptional regulator [Sphingobacteriaceae bacterium]|nr:Crp/Fnr family transcriptional regulator [Sphingobacteriaceae bacterium]
MFSLKLFTKYCTKDWQTHYKSNKQTFYFESDSRIFDEGDPVKGIYFVEKGYLKVLSKTLDGSEKIIRLVAPGMILGHRGFNAKFYPISAESLTEVVLTFFPLSTFINMLKANPDMSIYLLNFMSDELRDTESRMKNLMISNPKIRIAIILIQLIDILGYDKKSDKKLLAFTLTRTDFANMGGTTYETVIRVLAQLKKDKLIGLEGKEITILNEKKLRELARNLKQKH